MLLLFLRRQTVQERLSWNIIGILRLLPTKTNSRIPASWVQCLYPLVVACKGSSWQCGRLSRHKLDSVEPSSLALASRPQPLLQVLPFCLLSVLDKFDGCVPSCRSIHTYALWSPHSARVVVNRPEHTLDTYVLHCCRTHRAWLGKSIAPVFTNPCNIERCAFCDGSFKPKNSPQLCVESCDTIVFCAKASTKRYQPILVTTGVDD